MPARTSWGQLRHLRRERRGVALTEFAFAAPIFIVLGTCGLELTNYANSRMRISQITMSAADNLSRVGLDTGLAIFQLTESDVNDTFTGAEIAGGALGIRRNGRMIVSSLEMNAQGGQWIHWQRCKGQKRVNSQYGGQGTGATGTAFAGMGTGSQRVTAPSSAIAVIYVEMTYDYQPFFPFLWADTPTGPMMGSVFGNGMKTFKYGNAYMVRDNRDLNADGGRNGGKGLFNPNNPLTGKPADAAACDKFT